MRRAPIRWRSRCSGTSPRHASAPPGPSLRGILRHLIVRTTRDDREAVGDARRHAQRQVTACADPQVPGDRGCAGRLLSEHSRQGRPLHGGAARQCDWPAAATCAKPLPARRSWCRQRRSQTNVEAADACEARARRGPRSAGPMSSTSTPAAACSSIPLATPRPPRHAVEETPGRARRRLKHPTQPAHARRPCLLAARVEDALAASARDPVDHVVLDPRVRGARLMSFDRCFERVKPPPVVYVSCNPEALAAELPSIMEAGYAHVARAAGRHVPTHDPHRDRRAARAATAEAARASRRQRNRPSARAD